MQSGKFRFLGGAILLVAFSALLGGCAGSIGLVDPLESTGRVTTTAAHQLFPDRFDLIDLVTTLDPESKRQKYKPGRTSTTTPGATPAAQVDAESWEFSAALHAFYDYQNLEMRRNSLQDELMMRSETRCNIYKNYLKRVETTQSTYTGILTTMLGGVGALTKDIGRAQLHSGLAAISSGIGAELKQGFFSDVAVAVLIPGIDEKRLQIRNRIQKARGTAPSIQNYTIEAALRDIAEYHGACSIVVGLDAAKDAIREVRNPGILSMNDTLRKLRVTTKLLDRNADPAQIEAEMAAFGFSGGVVSTVARPDSGMPMDLWTQKFSALNSLIASVEQQVLERTAQTEVKEGATGELKKIIAKQYTPPGHSKAGCGIQGVRERIRDQMSNVLAEFGDFEKDVAKAQANYRFAANDVARANTRAKLDGEWAKALTGNRKLQLYYERMTILVRETSRKVDTFGLDATQLNAESASLAEDITLLAQLKLEDVSADKTVDCH